MTRLFLLALLLVCCTPAAAQVSPGASASLTLSEAERRLDREPSARDVQRWTERALRIDPGQARRLLRDSEAAGALPWIRLRGRFEDDDRIDRDEASIIKETQQDTRWTAELWIEWDLADAVAGPARFKAVKESREQLELRQAVLQQVTQAYHDRQRLLLEDALDVLGDDAALARSVGRRVRIRELDATLDAMTDGRWGEALRALEDDAPRYRPRPPVGPPRETPGDASRVVVDRSP